MASIEFENARFDVTTVFGANSPEAQEVESNPAKAQADFLGIAIHSAQNSPPSDAGKPDLLPDEPGGYDRLLFGNKYALPAISPQGPVTDIDSNVIQDSQSDNWIPRLVQPVGGAKPRLPRDDAGSRDTRRPRLYL